jgi:hypothetical protein
MNYESQPLYKHEVERMKADPVIIQRVIESYKLMLDFYGMRLASEATGLVERSLRPKDYQTRYHNLVRKSPPTDVLSDRSDYSPPLPVLQDHPTTIFAFPAF